ncbi:MAG: hypothetical protein JWM28_2614 [Chitinophagaceae bacterium]|nr:hypothetical protein [Chitinophagaceae bacterium]
MRKMLVLLSGILVVSFSGLYLMIPGKLHVSQVQFFQVPPGPVVRGFNDVSKRKEWWPGQLKNHTANYDGLSFTIPALYETYLQTVIINTGITDTVNSLISANVHAYDSSYLYWECTLNCTLSPVNRIQQYLKARKIKKSMDSILNSFSSYASTLKNIYDLSIQTVRVTDSVLISEKREFAVYPGTTQVYDLIHSLNNYIQEQDGKQTGFPMIHITQTDTHHFSLMAAIPINKTIKENDDKKIKKLLYDGNLLMAEVKGGIFSIDKAFQKLELYKEDYKLISPAIPYQSLITDRTKVTDTSQWVTRIYYPFY